MERLTIPDVIVDKNTTRRTIIDASEVRKYAMDFYWRLKKIEDILGDDYDLDRLRELVKAGRDGRCVVRPKDYDGTIFRGWNNQILSSKHFAWFMKELGENFFLTREAAEAALKGKQDG